MPLLRDVSRAVAASLLVGVLCLAGCSASSSDSTASDDDALTARVDIGALLEDDDLRGGDKLTAAEIQDFLETKGSYLATHQEAGRTAAQIIADSCHDADISPLYMLARIQAESSLITSGTSRSLSEATGCACPDGASCSHHDAGFTSQVECAASLHASYFDELAKDGVTRAGFGVGKKSRTLDPCSVVPTTKATAVLYTYTPWVGPYGKQCSSHGSSGSTSLVSIFRSYQRALGM